VEVRLDVAWCFYQIVLHFGGVTRLQDIKIHIKAWPF
jgi:hypothetical protein